MHWGITDIYYLCRCGHGDFFKTSAPYDPQQMRQILLNLFINSIEAMPQGGDLFVETSETQDEFILTVKDTGCGISKENLKKIFNPFFTTKSTGTGLGLCVTQSILEGMNGKLEIDSKVGVGTEIRVRLPINVALPSSVLDSSTVEEKVL